MTESLHEMRRRVADAVICAYHTTRLSETPAAEHVLTKSHVVAAFESLERSVSSGIQKSSASVRSSIGPDGVPVEKRLWLQGARIPSDPSAWTVCKSLISAKEHMLLHGCPEIVAMAPRWSDSTGSDGLDFVWWLISKDIRQPDFIPENFHLDLYGGDAVIVGKIHEVLNGYLRVARPARKD